jgi:chemotaxis family two-component system sensor kinase Cph1
MNGLVQAKVDLTNCDREPIHIPGAILPHGAMLVLERDSLIVIQAAGDTAGLLGRRLEDLLGQSVDTLFNADQTRRLRLLCQSADLTRPRHLLDPALRLFDGRPLDASLHRSADTFVLEFEAGSASDPFVRAPLEAVQEMIDGLESASDLEAFCQRAAEQVKRVIGYDRVMVYRFMPDDSGWVIAEAREPRLGTFLDLHYPASDIPVQARALYLRSWLRLITSVDYEPAPLTPPLNPRTGQPLDMSQATLRDVSPIHREYLRNMGVGASMSISIILGGRLWGLIACHHYGPRQLPRALRAVCELFGGIFSFQLEARERKGQMEARMTSRSFLQALLHGLAHEDDYARAIIAQSPNLLEYVPCTGVAVRTAAGITTAGKTPDHDRISALADWLTPLMDERGGVYATDRLGSEWPEARHFAAIGSGLLAISISRAPREFVLWFRPEEVTTVSWGGDPSKQATIGPLGDRLTPRKSFEIWKQEMVGRSRPWAEAEQDAAGDLRVALLDVVLHRIDTTGREREAVRAHEKLLMAELDHRVKNTLANVQALVVQTSRNAESLKQFVLQLQGRIGAMARAHSLLTEGRWLGLSLRGLFEEELAQYSTGGKTVQLVGPDTTLVPGTALVISLAVHELATNAAKYGALSDGEGKVA